MRILLIILFSSSLTQAKNHEKPRFKAVAFDYFVIFNPNSVVKKVEKIFPGKGLKFTQVWRQKQFEYGFLRTITNEHADFFKVTGDALDYTVDAFGLSLGSKERKTLLDAYLALEPWPDTIVSLKKLRKAGVRIITIANFSKQMLIKNARNAGIEDLFDVLLSTEKNKTYKPDPQAYELGMKILNLKKNEILFAAFGGWDAYGAKKFGYPTYWVNRFRLPSERLSVKIDGTSSDFTDLLNFVLGY